MVAAKTLLNQVLAKVTPTAAERKKQKMLAGKIIGRINEMEGKHVDVMLCGSNARDTHLRGDNDLDIFVLFPKKLSREEFENEGLRIGKSIFRGHQWEKAYSEHPYIRGKIEGFDVEIVPSYKVADASMLQSAVDRTPFHNAYLRERLSEKKKGEARLLRQFLKGIKAYGADVKASSVPGYVVELLVLHYGSFLNALKGISKWQEHEAIDIEKHYRNEKEVREKFPDAPLVVVDPTDRKRNVAAALSLNQFSRVVAASRAFLKKPEKSFFFGKRESVWSLGKLKKMLGKKCLIGVSMGYPKELSDIIWGQMIRLRKKIAKALEMADFEVLRSDNWTDESKVIAIVFELGCIELQKSERRVGPLVTDVENSKRFLEKHPKLIAGPRIENGRWVIEVQRKHVSAEKFLKELLKKEKRVEKAAIRKALNKGVKVLDEKGIAELYKKNRGFAEFLTTYLKGEEEFL